MARISLLQLDTKFPRIPGDVGCAETFHCELEIIRVPAATVAKIVTAHPDEIDLRPFEDAIASATGDLKRFAFDASRRGFPDAGVSDSL